MFQWFDFLPLALNLAQRGLVCLWSQSTIYNVSVDFLQVGSILSVFSFLKVVPWLDIYNQGN